MDWAHTYNPDAIPSKAVISEHTPGKQIASAITEIQDRCVTDIDVEIGAGLKGQLAVSGNTIIGGISVSDSGPSDSDGGGAGLPSGGEQYQVLQRDSSGNAVWGWVRAHE